jgi:hypothetical protein
MQFTFLFPDALSLEPTAAEPVRALASRVFARYRQTRMLDDEAAAPLEMPWEQWLRRLYGVSEGASIEAASAFADQQATPCWRLTPVHLHLGRDHMVLTDPAQLRLSPVDAEALRISIAPLLADCGLGVQIGQPDRWYMNTINQSTSPFDDLIGHGWRAASGRNIDVYSPTGAASRQWRRLENEIQMTWYEHPVNEQRALHGLPAVNSLWFDGRADLAAISGPPSTPRESPAGFASPARFTPSVRFAPFTHCFTDLACLKGLNSASQSIASTGSTCSDLSAFNIRVLTGSASNGKTPAQPSNILIAVDPLNIERSEGEYACISIWRRIAALLEPLQGNVRVVLSGDRRLVELERKRYDRWAFWRQSKPVDWFEWAHRDH